ncbi:2-polyprenyl-6-methoxyphenol hydroxylase-like oxidoreductase [Mycobacteroides abscessus subsp. bolletii]|nr:2-polyprenyl-6-methoxyphenol hydroxylase-like oxidoreductase [Mycobacteroides abscessus subsp. bolletii]
MQDAFNVAWKLAETASGRAGESLLDSYHTERYPVAETMIKFTERLI